MRQEQGFGGTKPLIRTGALRSSISVVRVAGSLAGGTRVFIGIARSARAGGGSGGRGGGGAKAPAKFQRVAIRDTSGRFMGFQRIPVAQARARGLGGGAASGGMTSLANIGEIHEYGRAIKKTKKMARFLWAMLKRFGGSPRAKGSGSIVIPKRSFVRSVVHTHAKPADVKKRFYQRVAKSMNGDFGRVAGASI